MILCSGVFDGLHAGHVAYLRSAFSLGCGREPLVVAVADDEYVRRTKGREPRWPLAQRLRVIEELRCVSSAVIHDDSGVGATIWQLKPGVFVKGHDWQATNWLAALCAEAGCQLVYVNSGISRHTSDDVSAHQ